MLGGTASRRCRSAILPIVRALEEGSIDAALVSAALSSDLEARGFSVLLRDYPSDIDSFEGGMVVATSYLSAHSDVVENVLGALVEALAFTLSARNGAEVARAFEASFGITDAGTVAGYLAELKRKPYPSLPTFRKMQRIIGQHEPRVLDLEVADWIDDRLVRKLDDSGTIDGLYAAYGAT